MVFREVHFLQSYFGNLSLGRVAKNEINCDHRAAKKMRYFDY
jgi:hypothetical protein